MRYLRKFNESSITITDKIIDLKKYLEDNYDIMLDTTDLEDGYHDSVRDWVENSVFVHQDDLTDKQIDEIETIVSNYEKSI